MNTIIIILLAIVLIWLFRDYKFTKDQFAKLFGVTRKTMKKWVDLFCTSPAQKLWNSRRRKFSMKEFSVIVKSLGFTFDKRFWTKEEIATLCYANYSTIAENVALNHSELNFSVDDYHKVDKLPPRIAQGIIRVLVSE